MIDRFELYERCVQNPADLASLLRALHAHEPRVLGEDFCGTAALSAAWIAAAADRAAIAVDHDPEPLARAPRHERLRLVTGDVVEATDPGRDRADLIYAGNFSIGEWHERPALLRYLRHARARVERGGLFVCDLYGGESAYQTGEIEGTYPWDDDGRTVRYTWEQREADPLTGRVVNALHFAIEREGAVETTLRDAFVYRWRLWSVPELRDAMTEAGFSNTAVFPRVAEAVDDDGCAYVQPITDADDLGDTFDVLVAARNRGEADA